MQVTFIDSGREPKCKPDPAFPYGIDVDLSHGAIANCSVALPYPAPRCGAMHVKCNLCGNVVVVTVAGRPDDPRTVKMACLDLCPPSDKASTIS